MAANQQVERIRAAVAKNPRKMTLQLARDLGVPEVEVIRAFPADRVIELDIARREELVRSFEALGLVRVLVSNGAATIEVDGRLWNLKEGKEAGGISSLQVILKTLAISGNGLFLLGLSDKTIYILELRTKKVVGHLKTKATISSLAISRTTTFFSTGIEDSTGLIWNLEDISKQN
jgi:hypothetical protein